MLKFLSRTCVAYSKGRTTTWRTYLQTCFYIKGFVRKSFET
jgi:hypothetical protein